MVAEEAAEWNYPKEQYKRVKALCCLVPVIPPSDIFPYEVRGAQLRMLMKRNEYVSDVFSLSDEDWAFQKDLMGEVCRLTTFFSHNLAGKYFLPMIREVDNVDKAQFIKGKYWLWDQRTENKNRDCYNRPGEICAFIRLVLTGFLFEWQYLHYLESDFKIYR